MKTSKTSPTIRIDICLKLLESRGLILPYGLQVGNYTKDFPSLLVTEEEWKVYRWKPDRTGSSPKPLWSELVMMQEEIDAAELEEIKATALANLRSFCEELICQVYGGHSLNHELQIRERLANSTNSADQEALQKMNAWRDYYRRRYHEIKYWLQNTANDYWMIRLCEMDSPLLWDNATWTPPGDTEPWSDHASVPEYTYEVPESDPPSSSSE